MTISNFVSILLVVGFMALAAATGMPLMVVLENHLACGAAVLVLTFCLFAFGWIGGGDAKLAAATAVWLGWMHLFDYGLEASLLGAALTLAILYWRKISLPGWFVRQSLDRAAACGGIGRPLWHRPGDRRFEPLSRIGAVDGGRRPLRFILELLPFEAASEEAGPPLACRRRMLNHTLTFG